MDTIVFDTETTGIPKHPDAKPEIQPRIIEFGGVRVNSKGEILSQLELLINPEQPLEEVITKITGLTDDVLADKPTFDQVEPQLRAFFEGVDAVLAHNLPFDTTMIDMELARFNLPPLAWPELRICTVQEHAEEWGKRPRLLELYEHYHGEPLAQKHRALDDVLALLSTADKAGVLP